MKTYVENGLKKLKYEQQNVYDKIMTSFKNNEGGIFYLDAPGRKLYKSVDKCNSNYCNLIINQLFKHINLFV